jgi:methionine synthase II (cobalamin-independent)
MSTAIGSLPHKDARKALKLIEEAFKNISVWPQLPAKSRLEDMTAQYIQGLPGCQQDQESGRYYIDTTRDEFYLEVEEFIQDYETIITEKDLSQIDKYAITSEHASALGLWLDIVQKTKPEALKGQITGPFTYATSIVDQENRCAFYDDSLREIIEKFLALKALWQIEQFKKVCPDAIYIMSLDEPTISQYGSTAFMTVQKNDIISSFNFIAEVIHNAGSISFIHCCGNTDWSVVTSSDIKFLNFDAYNFADSIALYPENIAEFIEKGNFIAWGLVPTLDPEQVKEMTKEKAIDIFEKTIDKLACKGVNKEKLIRQSIITPACGTGSLSEELAEFSLRLTSDVAAILRSKYI